VIDIRSQEIVWELPDCERVFFLGVNAASLDTVEFKDRLIKLRSENEEESEWEDGEEDGPSLVLKDEESEEVESEDEEDKNDKEKHADRMEKLHRGIMVIKS